jgi:nucleoside-diphosphate-sugar epimerase
MLTLVTGGAGFIGSNLVRALLRDGHQVRVLDNFSTGHRSNLEGLDIELIEGDLRSYERVAAATRGVEIVFHQGALPSVPRSIQDPLTSSEVNVTGTLNVVLASRDHAVRRIVAASSSSLYGDLPGMPRQEDQPLAPLSPYAVAKQAAERYVLVANRVFGIETVALRYFNVFGPRQDPESGYAAVIPKFTRLMQAGKRPTIYGDGGTSRDFTYVDNVVEANIAAAHSSAVGLPINVACGESRTLNELVETLTELIGCEIEPDHGPPREGDVSASMANIDRARSLLGYHPSIGFREGLERTVSWIAERSPSRIA